MKNTVQKQKRHLTGRLLSLLMLLFVFTGAVKADIVEIGDGTQTTNVYPTQATYNLQLDITAGGVAGQLTVNDGTANNGYIPFYGLYEECDEKCFREHHRLGVCVLVRHCLYRHFDFRSR